MRAVVENETRRGIKPVKGREEAKVIRTRVTEVLSRLSETKREGEMRRPHTFGQDRKLRVISGDRTKEVSLAAIVLCFRVIIIKSS